MKKSLAVKSVIGFVCMALMVSVLSFSGTIAGAGFPLHDHIFHSTGIFCPLGPAVSISDVEHRTPGYLILQCACGETSHELGYVYQYHSKAYFDLGHVSGTHTHKREATCRYCNYHAILCYYCPGNPCIDPHD